MSMGAGANAKQLSSQRRKRIAIFGCTGSIGRSALELVATQPEHFEIYALVGGTNDQLLNRQIDQFKPRFAALQVGDSSKLIGSAHTRIVNRARAAEEIACDPDVDLVLAAVVGMAGLPAVVSALKAGKRVALANKESLVCAGALVTRLAAAHGAQLIPVDSEHSAIFQALQGERREDVAQLVLTASGGPFLHTPLQQFPQITLEQALRHPRWNMGPKITIDSATLVNKALELIEAHFLFGMPETQIEVLVHPQSIVHSLVAFKDGSQIAQLSLTDMKGPIAYALNYPQGRLSGVLPKLDLAQIGKLEFLALDTEKFPAVSLARETLRAGGAAPAIFNIANEIAVADFISGRITFDRIVATIQNALSRFANRSYTGVDELFELQTEVKEALSI